MLTHPQLPTRPSTAENFMKGGGGGSSPTEWLRARHDGQLIVLRRRAKSAKILGPPGLDPQVGPLVEILRLRFFTNLFRFRYHGTLWKPKLQNATPPSITFESFPTSCTVIALIFNNNHVLSPFSLFQQPETVNQIKMIPKTPVRWQQRLDTFFIITLSSRKPSKRTVVY